MLSLKKVDRQQWVKFLTHLVVILMLFFLPELMLNYASPHRMSTWAKMMYLKSAVFVAFFYINYYQIIPRTLFRQRQNYVAFVGWNVLLIALYIAVYYHVLPHIIWDDSRRHFRPQPEHLKLIKLWSHILRDLAMIILTIALSAFMRFAEKWSAIERHHQALLASQREDELQSLKSQLNPHFLFNTLNTIYSLIEVSPTEAQAAVHRLSRLLRHVLYENSTHSTLRQEISFAESYISLMEMRLGKDAIRADFSKVSDPEISVPPLLFVTLIENAFKHGNTGHKDQPIEITISSDSEGNITCHTFNHFVPKETGEKSATGKGGIGLANLRRRLVLLYGDRARLTTEVDGDTYAATLRISTQPDKPLRS
ncbi:MAG: sensor histidine kinase [Muribaculaceae bacterium]|nr:sensor histidine kinase [Muribaculaceae bacterium]